MVKNNKITTWYIFESLPAILQLKCCAYDDEHGRKKWILKASNLVWFLWSQGSKMVGCKVLCHQQFLNFSESEFNLLYDQFMDYQSLVIEEQKMKFFIKDFFSQCDQIRSFLWIWSHVLKKALMENFIFCALKRTPQKRTKSNIGWTLFGIKFRKWNCLLKIIAGSSFSSKLQISCWIY